MITFLNNKFNLTQQQVNRVNELGIELSDEYLTEIWLDNPQLSFDDFCNEIELQELLQDRANNYDLSTMTRIDGTMTTAEVYAKLLNISIEEATIIVNEHSPQSEV